MQDFRARQPNQFDLPERIHRLGELAYNLWWTWHFNAQRVFRFVDPILWEELSHNPILFLRQVSPRKLDAAAQDLNYVDVYDATMADFDAYMSAEDTWFNQNYPDHGQAPIAYFSTEFGLHESLPMYAGGLGILAGDHLKEASDLGVPLVAMGFIYTKGYFFQYISEDGWQGERGITLHFDDMPVMPILDDDGEPLQVSLELPERTLHARLWEIHVGRVPLYLLDSNVEANSEADRNLTAQLYSSDPDLRISQEMLLGIGGVRALRTLGYAPVVWHMNEGHSAFLSLEQARELIKNGETIHDVSEKVRAQNIFTTHTPVPAGNDEFPLWLVDKYFAKYWPSLGLDQEDFFDLAKNTSLQEAKFSMPILALRLSAHHNGVSELHGHVARGMWNFLWPGLSQDDVPISSITNGVHTGTWLARRLGNLFSHYMGKHWWAHLDDQEMWNQVLEIPDEELWKVRRHLKRKMVYYIMERGRQHWIHDGFHPVQAIASGVMLDPYALTIGFARRFATYKRANLVLSDLDRLLNIINRRDRPVQIIFAGKAHPADEAGKQLIQNIYRIVKQAENGGRLVFLDDYDMNLAHYLVQGVDVWLNTPRRPLEASGTSGQKAALNGVLNFSVLDGWWREGYNGKNGWAIGEDKDTDDSEEQDRQDAESLYDVLENQIIPLYYDSPQLFKMSPAWMAMVKETIRTLAPQFSARRMLKEYVQDMYFPVMKERQTEILGK